jgi:hypothetical protein
VFYEVIAEPAASAEAAPQPTPSPKERKQPKPPVEIPQLAHDADEVETLLNESKLVVDALTQRANEAKSTAAALEKKLADATKARKLSAIGMVKRVVLYDTEIRLPTRTVSLSPSVRAAADHQGNKQVVQGWVRRSTNDRREMMLQVEWPGGHEIVYWERNDKKSTGAWVTPPQVHSMAAAINQAAAASPRVRATLRDRRLTAAAALHAHLEESSAVVREHADLVSTSNRALQDVVDERQSLASTADRGFNKRVQSELKSASRQISDGEKALERAQPVLAAADTRVLALTTELEAARTGVEVQEVTATAEIEAPPPVDAEPPEEVPASSEAGADPIELLEKLARLHAAGVLTTEEFVAKKAEILRRL